MSSTIRNLKEAFDSIMRTIKLGSSSLEVPVVAVGCMRINAISKKEAERFVQTALEQGANFFDHADIYGGGECEEIFADAIQMNEAVREKIILQSKCGIREGRFDFSKEYILQSVDGILQRLKTDYLDVLLLHRPDALVEPEEVAEAFDLLESSGKVRHFGVSNQNPMQIELLKKFVRQPIVANQLQLSITNATMISSGINVNMENESAINRDGSVLDYCRLHDVTIQPWSPFQYGFFEGVFLGNDLFPELNKKIDELAEKYEVSNTTIAIAWLLRHPANMQPVIGTMNLKRLKDCCKASEIRLTREEWYEIYRAAGNILP
jgi:predicted oxidoreductase